MRVTLLSYRVLPIWLVLGDDDRTLKTVVLPEEEFQAFFHDIPALQARIVALEEERTEALQKEVLDAAEENQEGEEPGHVGLPEISEAGL